MKKNILSAMPVLLLAGIFYSCQKENETNTNYKQETDKIETSIASGVTKNDAYLTHLPKEETDASEELKKKISAALIKSYSKTNAMAEANNEIFGVFKDGSCGSYRELDIKMDCEDNNSASTVKGYVGTTTVHNGDIYYQFCLVNDRKNFPHIKAGGYAVLSLDKRQPTNGTTIGFERYFDNEDHDNQNTVYLDGKQQSLPYDSFPGIYISGNSSLSFLLLLKDSSGPAKPPVLAGVSSYGVIGSFGQKNGSIYSDDEDFRNANAFYSNTASASSVWFKGVMEFGKNTTIRVTKAR